LKNTNFEKLKLMKKLNDSEAVYWRGKVLKRWRERDMFFWFFSLDLLNVFAKIYLTWVSY